MKLRHKDTMKLQGQWKLTALYKDTNKVYKVLKGRNLIVTVGKELIGYLLQDKTGYNVGVTYHAIGTNNTPPDVGNIKLTAEVNRKAVTAKTQSSSPTNQFVWSTFYAAGECTYEIEEAGVFGHNASLTIDSGVLFSHYLAIFDNSAGIFDLIFDYILTIG